jgi:hypothetical protein
VELDRFAERVPFIMGSAPEIGAYRRWLTERRLPERQAAAEPRRDYLFLDERARFEPRKEDVVVPQPGLAVRQRGKTAVLEAGGSETDAGVGRKEAEAILDAMDGRRTLLEVRWRSGVDGAVLGRFLRAAFGRVVFAPQAVAALEERLPAGTIVRFPASPYGVERAYWQNQIDVRARYQADPGLDDSTSFVRMLREIHVLALMGRSLDSFYKPASPVSDEVVAPGVLYLTANRLLETSDGPIYLDGPRVTAPAVGGERFFARLAGAPRGAEDARWGRFVVARSEKDREPRPIFLPPRPIESEHFDALRAALADGSPAGTARFHWCFVRLHPFHCANQSLAMNLVNAVLGARAIPHLWLDHLALRLDADAYAAVFARAVDAHAVDATEPARRLAAQRERTRRALAFMDRVSACKSDAEADALVAAEPDAARLSLLSASP